MRTETKPARLTTAMHGWIGAAHRKLYCMSLHVQWEQILFSFFVAAHLQFHAILSSCFSLIFWALCNWTTWKLIEYANHIFLHERLHFAGYFSIVFMPVFCCEKLFSFLSILVAHIRWTNATTTTKKTRNKLTAIWSRRHFFVVVHLLFVFG